MNLNRTIYQKIYVWLSFCVFFIIVFCIIQKTTVWLRYYFYKPMDYVVISGNRCITTKNDIFCLITQSELLGTFVIQDINIIQKKIEQLPWIKQVSIRKHWPDTLKIHLVEYIPLAYWNNDSVISTTGVVFYAPKNLIDDNYGSKKIPVFFGPTGTERDVLANYLIFSGILGSVGFKIKSIKTDVRNSWQLVLQNNIHLNLGRKNILDRLCFFIKIYPILFYKINEQYKYIDLRYKSGFAVK